MRNLIIMLLLAGLAACSGTTDTPPAEVKTEAPAAEPAKTAETTPPPADPVPAEPAKAPDPPKAADVKPADKPTTPPPANKGRLLARFQTSMGNFTAELNEKEAPGTVENFVGLASGTKEWTDPRTGTKQKKPYYDGLTFHRIMGTRRIPPNGFMIQGGDPMGTGIGGPGYGIKDEYNNLKHDKAGTLAMARTSAPDSAGSQFYVTVTATPQLDGAQPPYVVFGYVIEGVDVVKKIGEVPTDPGDRPLTPVIINKITIERK
jgi:peptidyl-prolyl cis-trans isomerase A (cyclophilin A)